MPPDLRVLSCTMLGNNNLYFTYSEDTDVLKIGHLSISENMLELEISSY